MGDVFTKAKRREIMQSVRRAGTRPEQILEELLEKEGVTFEQNVAELPGKPDFVITNQQLVIFVHGCFWHGHESCRKGRALARSNVQYWKKKIEANQRRDARVARVLRNSGYRVYTAWECELKKRCVPTRIVTALAAPRRS